MEIVSISTLPVGSLVWETRAAPSAKSGVKSAQTTSFLTVVCKATYVLSPTESPLASEQEPLNEDDAYWDDDRKRSLHAATDLVPFKTRADVLLVGHAFAPNKRAARSIITRLVVNDVDKSIEAFSDRHFSLDGKLHEGSLITRMSLSYERAQGGAGTSNPVGMRGDARDGYGTSYVPNLQPPGVIVASPTDVFDPIGYGPIAPFWPTRRDRLGRHAGVTSVRALLEGPVPDDIDPLFWNAAPYDQLVSGLRNNERIVLENLNPEHARLVTSLPGLGPRAFVERRAAGVLEMPMTADTLFIDTDMGICTLTWRGSFQLEHPNERCRVVVGMEQPGKPLTWLEAKRAADRGEMAAPSSANDRRSRPESDAVKVTDAARNATSTFARLDPKELAERGSGGLPFGKSAPPGTISPLAPPPPPPPRTSSASAAPAPPKPSSRVVDVDEFEELDPFQDTTATFVESPHGAGTTAPGVPRPTTRGALPFAAPEPKDMSASHAVGLPFVAPSPSSRPAAAPPPLPVAPSASSASAPSASSAVAPLASAAPAPALAPPPLYIAESMGSWGTAQPPPSLASAPSAAPSPVTGPAHGWDAPPRAAAPQTNAAPPGPPPLQFRAPAPAAPVLAASNAAAGKSAPWYPPRSKDIDDGALAPAVEAPPKAEAKPSERELVELLWYEPSQVPRMRRQAIWREILDNLESRPADADIEETSPYRSAAQAEERRDVFEIIARGKSSDGERMNAAIEKAIRSDGKFVPPMVLVTGDLAFPFDEAETLKAYIAAATPIATGDESLRASMVPAERFLGAPAFACSTAVAEGLIARIREAFCAVKRPVPADYLDTQTARMLLEKRCYQRREVFGGMFLRGLFHGSAVTGVSAQALASGATSAHAGGGRSPGASGSAGAPAAPGQPIAQGPMPTYLPDSLAKSLPLFQRFRVRLVVEVHLAVDQNEPHPLGLKVVAVARAVERPILR